MANYEDISMEKQPHSISRSSAAAETPSLFTSLLDFDQLRRVSRCLTPEGAIQHCQYIYINDASEKKSIKRLIYSAQDPLPTPKGTASLYQMLNAHKGPLSLFFFIASSLPFTIESPSSTS